MMIIPNLKKVCEQAKLYYYDFLFLKDKSDIPEHFLSHIRQCGNCQEQIYQLKTALTQLEQSGPFIKGRSGTPLTNMLKLHFSYVDQDINCTIVKPFLPVILDTSMQISIPTPITTHMDHCPECVSDLKKISDLKLNNENLFRLSRLFEEKPKNDNIICSRAKSDIMAFVMLAFHESDEQILKHLCSCSKCRTVVYQYRESIRKELMHGNNGKPCFLSSRLSYDNIFDFVIPYGLDIDQYKKSESRQSCISHIRRCPFCLEKIQEFHHIISDIKERADSNTITKYNVEELNQNVNEVNSKDLYAGYPVHVEVSKSNEEAITISSDSTINFTAALKHKILADNYKSIYKTGFVGLLLIMFILAATFLYSPNAKALTLTELYKSINNKVNNVHISSFKSDSGELFEEKWISRTSKIKITKNQDELSLLDINENSLKTKKPDSDIIYIKTLSRELLLNLETTINSSLGLIPFYTKTEITQGAEWHKATEDYQDINSETEVYDLSYFDDTFGDHVFTRLRYTVKTDTDLPVKVETLRKLPNESEYSPETYMTIEYLSDKEFNDIKNSFFSE